MKPPPTKIKFNAKNNTARFGELVLTNIHPEFLCAARPSCIIHRPSNHGMRHWPLHLRSDKGVWERICPHGTGHPDPDDAAYQSFRGFDSLNVHGCDGCCHERKAKQKAEEVF